MGTIERGYGSEWHLLRFLGRHRHLLNKHVEEAIKMDEPKKEIKILDWLDFKFNDNKKVFCDSELEGLDFLDDKIFKNLKEEWKEFWPQTGTQMNWDAVGIAEVDKKREIILVEAKSHVGELGSIQSKCGAKEKGGLPQIKKAINKTIEYYKGILSPNTDIEENWLDIYYQFANRLCTLYFLNKHTIPTRLVYIYFIGDHGKGLKKGDYCPKFKNGENGWDEKIKEMYKNLGFSSSPDRVHKVFLPIRE